MIAGTGGPRGAARKRARSGTLGVRPEHVTLAFERGVAAQVDTIEYLGADSLVGCRIGNQPVLARVAGRVALVPGDTTWLAWAPGAQFYFNADGRARLRTASSMSTALTMTA